jgi:thiol-disulfide isomerase/thioredoxin
MEKALGEGDLATAKGDSVPIATLKGKYVGLYFGAKWCGPCRAFTPKMVSTYQALKKEDTPLEIIFVSSDKSAAEMKAYMTSTKMNCLSIPFGDKRLEWLPVRHTTVVVVVVVVVVVELLELCKIWTYLTVAVNSPFRLDTVWNTCHGLFFCPHQERLL